MAQRKHILVVDDEPQNQRLYKDFLDALGHSSESANDGLEALEKLESGFDLVLLDIMMPGMDGFEVVRRIRNNLKFADIPILIATVLDDKETRIRAVQAGANDFLSKPIDGLEFSVRIESLLKMKDTQDAIRHHRDELEAIVENAPLNYGSPMNDCVLNSQSVNVWKNLFVRVNNSFVNLKKSPA